MKRYVALLAVLGAGGLAISQAAAGGATAGRQTGGGLSVLPAIIEHNAQPGPLATLTVANRSAAPLSIAVTPRPWAQSGDGKVAANRRRTLAGVTVDKPSFTLAPGATQTIALNLNAAPAAGALYGAVEVVGLPADVAKRKGVVLGYRLIGRIRILPSAPKLRLVPGAIKVTQGKAVLPITNAGNTLDPVTGRISVKDARGTRNAAIRAVKVLPGGKVNLPLGSKLTTGKATAKVTLRQRGKTQLTLSKRFEVK